MFYARKAEMCVFGPKLGDISEKLQEHFVIAVMMAPKQSAAQRSATGCFNCGPDAYGLMLI
jgi:hypothetical protein